MFNLDEYYPISPVDLSSYRTYMHHHLFSRVDLPPSRAHVPDGTVPVEFACEHAKGFDRWIEASGGLDLQLLGIGRNGHIGFNEPFFMPVDQALAQPTRMVELHPVIRAGAASGFGGVLACVPTHALTVDTLPILAARSVLILAVGTAKADAVARSLTGPMTAEVPASLLQAVPGKVT